MDGEGNEVYSFLVVNSVSKTHVTKYNRLLIKWFINGFKILFIYRSELQIPNS